jgi:hypothetical protein
MTLAIPRSLKFGVRASGKVAVAKVDGVKPARGRIDGFDARQRTLRAPLRDLIPVILVGDDGVGKHDVLLLRRLSPFMRRYILHFAFN